MGGSDERTGSLFSYVDIEARVPKGHPLRIILAVVETALTTMEREFAALYSRIGRPSIAPERLLRAMLLQAFYSIRSERQLMERLEFDLLFRWFVGLGIDDPVWDHSTFSKNRDRLLEGEIAAKLPAARRGQPKVKRLLSSDHFSVDDALIDRGLRLDEERQAPGRLGRAAPTQGGGRDADANFHDQKRSNDTHTSTTDPNAGLHRKGKEADKLCFIGQGPMKSRISSKRSRGLSL